MDEICAPACTGSLHDELVCKDLDVPEEDVVEAEQQAFRGIAESRPCYRCVSYMHSVGIKRVFWTTNSGQWEGAKVRDLMDCLAGDPTGSTGDPSSFGDRVFVTKHEVLMMRRICDGNRNTRR